MNKRKLTLDKEMLTSSNHPVSAIEGATTIICSIIKVIEVSLELTTVGGGGDETHTIADCPPQPTPGSCNGPGTCGTCGTCGGTCGSCPSVCPC